MAQRHVRFRPPRSALPPARRWAFVRGLGPAAARVPEGFDGAEAARGAVRLDLAARIAARRTLQDLVQELGSPAALLLFQTQARLAARSRLLLDLARDVALAASAASTPLVFLKSAALWLRAIVDPAARPAGDVDVLVPAAQADALVGQLAQRGFRFADVPAGAHQLAPLVDARGRVLEIHRFVPVIRAPQQDPPGVPATFEVLEAAGALEQLDGLPGRAFTPTRALMTAHAVVHGLVQNAGAPHVYCLTRVLADLIDLEACADVDLARQAFRFVEGGVARDDYDGLLRLAARLAEGDAALFDEAEGGAMSADAALLRHVIAGAFDDDYRRALRAHAALGGHAGGGGWRARTRAAWRALALTRAQVDTLYGRPRGAFGYLWPRLLRPLDLGRRWWRGRAAARRCGLEG